MLPLVFAKCGLGLPIQLTHCGAAGSVASGVAALPRSLWTGGSPCSSSAGTAAPSCAGEPTPLGAAAAGGGAAVGRGVGAPWTNCDGANDSETVGCSGRALAAAASPVYSSSARERVAETSARARATVSLGGGAGCRSIGAAICCAVGCMLPA